MEVAGLFEELFQQTLDFHRLLVLRMQQFEIRILGPALGAAEHLSPFIGENIPKKGTSSNIMILIW